MLGLHLVLVTLHRSLQLVLNKTLGIGDTKYHIQCSSTLIYVSDVITYLMTY